MIARTAKTLSIAHTIPCQRLLSDPWLESVLQVRSWRGTSNGIDSLLGTLSASDMLIRMAIGQSYGCWRTSVAIIGVLQLLLGDIGQIIGRSWLVLRRSEGSTWVFLGRSPLYLDACVPSSLCACSGLGGMREAKTSIYVSDD